MPIMGTINNHNQAKISIRGSSCTITGIPSDINTRLEKEFSYSVKNIEYTDAYQSGQWDGIHFLYTNRRFPIGLIKPISDILKDCEIDVTVYDHRQLGKKFDFPLQAPENLTLRPYQEEIVTLAIQNKACSVQLATGGGKTLMVAEYIRRLGLKTLFIVTSIEILKQTADRLEDYLGFPIGIVGDKQRDFDHITVSTWQSLKTTDQDYFNSVDCLVIDEAQHIGASVLRKIAYEISATYRLGMSGTLFREDGADLEIIGATGPIIKKIGYSELIKAGYLVPAKIETIRMSYPRTYRFQTYKDIYDEIVLNNPKRDQEIITIANDLIEQGKKVLIFVSRIAHGHKLASMAHDSKFIYASHPDRDQLLADFSSGKIKCLISTSILDEGYDLPIIDAVILAAPSKSLVKTIQRIGRALRPFPGKKDALIVDVADDSRYLWDHFQRRLKRYHEENLWVVNKILGPKKDPNDEWG